MLAWAACGMLLGWGVAPVVPVPKPDARRDLEDIAARLPYFLPNEFLCDRVPTRPDDPADTEYRRLIGRLAAARHDSGELVALLAHPDPKVRTLAAAAIYAREEPKLLPHLLALADDGAATFGEKIWPPSGAQLPHRPQTVGECVRQFLGFYTRMAGCSDGPAGFRDYWERRKGREFCASWFAVRLARATQWTTPFPVDRTERVRAVRRQIDRLPAADRAWTLLWLYKDRGSDALVSEEEMVALCRDLGPDQLLRMLRHQIPTDDPDLQPRKDGNYDYRMMMRFVLDHARQVLRPEDADALLACEAYEWDYRRRGDTDPMLSAAWAAAAAELQPDRAKVLLRDAFGRYCDRYHGRERAELAAALWRLVGMPEVGFLVEWFYTEEIELGAFPHARAHFIREVAAHRKGDVRRLLAAVISDARFDALDWQSLWTLAETVNELAGKPVVDPESLRDASHPYGVVHFSSHQERATAEYPKETAALLDRLGRWRAALREVAKGWAD